MGGSLGDILLMPAFGIIIVGIIMLVTKQESGGKVLMAGLALAVVSGFTDSHDTGLMTGPFGQRFLQ